MSILRFRVTFEDYDDIHRDIDLSSEHTFSHLFQTLLTSIGFDNKHTGVFYLADHNWRKGELMGEVSVSGNTKLANTELIDYIDDPHQKFLFTYDPDVRWNFNIELIRLIGAGANPDDFPKVAFTAGTAPVQYKETLLIPTKERTEPDGRGRKKKSAETNEDTRFDGEDELDEEGEISDSGPVEISMELPSDLDLETDTEIAKLAEEFNNTTEVDENASDESDEYGYQDDEDDEFNNEDDEYGSGGFGRGEEDDY